MVVTLQEGKVDVGGFCSIEGRTTGEMVVVFVALRAGRQGGW
jgi:hypothetical protein